jgi:predicted PurR-regulated permease PerM
MQLGRWRLFENTHQPVPTMPARVDAVTPVAEQELETMFSPPRWLHDLGFSAWYLVGLGAVLFGATWLLGATSTIVTPVVAGTVAAAVASPLVGAMSRRGVPRAVGAGLVLLGLLALTVVIVLLVVGGIVAQGDEIRALTSQAADKIQGWASDTGTSGTAEATGDVKTAVPDIGAKLLKGAASGVAGLTSIAFFISFTLFAAFFLLKDGPSFRRFADRHMGLPVPVATVITGNVLNSLRRYFLGVSIVAVFNAVVVGIGALILDVPLAGTIAVVTLVTAYVPFIGAFVSGAFAVLLALASQGSGTAAVMLVIVLLANGLLQNIVQPIAFGATLDLNPLVVLVVTIAAGSLFGMVGLILAAPLTSAAVHVFRDVGQARLAALRVGSPFEQAAAEP